MSILRATTALAVLLYLASAAEDITMEDTIPITEYYKYLNTTQQVIQEQKILERDHNTIFRIFNESEKHESADLKKKCEEYVKNREIYIMNVTEINNFIDKYNLSVLRPSIKTHSFLHVGKLLNSLHLTITGCNITIRKMMLDEDLDSLNRKNQAANNKSNTYNDRNVEINLPDVKDVSIPEKNEILHKIEEDIKEIYSIEEYCRSNDLMDICRTSILNISYWEELRRNITDDLLKLNKIITVHLIVNYVQPVLYIIVFFIGFSGNIVILIMFFRNKKFHKPQNMIILNLALADTLTLVINLPLNYAFEKIGHGDKGTHMLSQIFYFSRYLCLGLSAFSTVALCLQRFSATLKASNYIGSVLRQSKKDRAMKVIVIIWLLATIFALPRGVHGDIYIYETYSAGKKTYQIQVQVVTTLELIVLSVIPFVTISVLSWFTVRHFEDRERRIPPDIPKLHRTYQLELLSRSTKVIMATPLLFACTSLPFFLFYSLRTFLTPDINSPPDTVIKVISTSLLFLGCSFNPIGLYLASGNFRHYMRAMFGFGPRKSSLKFKQPQPSGYTTSEIESADTYV